MVAEIEDGVMDGAVVSPVDPATVATPTEAVVTCSFCGRTADKCQQVIQNPDSGAAICSSCVGQTLTIMMNRADARSLLETARVNVGKWLAGTKKVANPIVSELKANWWEIVGV